MTNMNTALLYRSWGRYWVFHQLHCSMKYHELININTPPHSKAYILN